MLLLNKTVLSNAWQVMFNSIGERLNNFSSIVINKVRKTVKAKQVIIEKSFFIILVFSIQGN